MNNRSQASRILFTCGREPAYIRNAVLQQALAQPFTLSCVTASQRWLPLRYAALALKLLAFRRPVDGWLVGFYGQPLMLWARLLTRKPILFDAYLSTYDTLCFDRQRFKPASPVGRLAFELDRLSCALADQVILDTQAHADYFHETFQIPSEKLHRLFVGCDESLFYPRPEIPVVEGQVLAFSSYLPLHGMEVVVRAAHLLRDDPAIQFRLVGSGMEYPRVRQLAQDLQLSNVTFLPPMPPQALAAEVAAAAVCLGGHFGASGKAARVIASKTFIGMAMQKAVIVGDNPANRELLAPGRDACFCPMADPPALAEAVRTLAGSPEMREALGLAARQTFVERASLPVLSQQLRTLVEEMLAKAKS